MNSFFLKDNRFIYSNEKEERILIDFNQYLENFSRVPFHNINDGPSLPGYIMDLQNWHKSLNMEEQKLYQYYTLIDVLLVAMHVKSADSKKVLVIGCQDGIMCYHLGFLLGKLHPESLMYCVSNTIGNGSESLWLDCISLIEKLPQLAFAATDYHNTNLKDDNFDMVIINGNVGIENWSEIVDEAHRVLKDDGMLITYSTSQLDIDNDYVKLFGEIEEYSLEEEGRIISMKKK